MPTLGIARGAEKGLRPCRCRRSQLGLPSDYIGRLVVRLGTLTKVDSPLQHNNPDHSFMSDHSFPRMHSFRVSTATIRSLAISDWWTLTKADVNYIAAALLGECADGWTRKGEQYVAIASVKLGATASKLDAEFSSLTAETKKILASADEDAPLRAAAFYHLRFENIHPLREGNGRIGRAIMAAQLHQALRIPVEETLGQINANQNDYMMAFPSNQPAVMFELMLDVLARLTGNIVAEESTKLPCSILPLYPDRRPLVKNVGQPKHPLPQARSTQQNQFFRKFR
jgi:Fic/DOC family